MREVISAYQKCVAGTVQRFGGFVAKYMGDGVLVYLGYPQAHEDDAERAVLFSRNAASYFPRPRLRGQTTMSIGGASPSFGQSTGDTKLGFH